MCAAVSKPGEVRAEVGGITFRPISEQSRTEALELQGSRSWRTFSVRTASGKEQGTRSRVERGAGSRIGPTAIWYIPSHFGHHDRMRGICSATSTAGDHPPSLLSLLPSSCCYGYGIKPAIFAVAFHPTPMIDTFG